MPGNWPAWFGPGAAGKGPACRHLASGLPVWRLRRKQIITRIPGTHRYQLTTSGRAVAVLFTKAHSRILGPGLAVLDPKLPPGLAGRSPLALAWKDLLRELDHFIDHGLAPA